MWIYDRKTGILSLATQKLRFEAYSGHGEGLNNPLKEQVHDLGPLPAGDWDMTDIINSPHTGPSTIILKAKVDTNTYTRDGFRIHGDNKQKNKSASNGCIVHGPASDREKVWLSGDHVLRVI